MSMPLSPPCPLSPYLRELLHRHGLDGALALSDALPDWDESALRDWFPAAWQAIAAQSDCIGRHLSPEGGESIYRTPGGIVVVSDDIWYFDAWASPDSMSSIAATMQQLRKQLHDDATYGLA